MFGIHSTKLKNEMEEFFEKYNENSGPPNDEFYSSLDIICKGLSAMQITYDSYNGGSNSDFLRIFGILTKIMQLLKKIFSENPVINTCANLTRFIIIARISTKIKSIILSEILVDQTLNYESQESTGNYEVEQFVCDVYKSKIEVFESNSETAQTINDNFTMFLFNYVKFLSQIKVKPILDKNIEFLVEVADAKILLRDYHLISHAFSKTLKILLMEKITKFCIKNKSYLEKSEFINSLHKDFKLEACILSYFILQRMCKYLEQHKINQSLKILSMFNIENISVDNNLTDSKFEKLYEKSVKLITFKKNKKIKIVHLGKFKKCLDTLHVLHRSFSSRLQNCPFAVILLSILSELVMETDLDKPITIRLIDLIIGYLDICELPSNFMAVSYGFNIYQKMKMDTELESMSKKLCRILSNNMGSSKAKLNRHLKTDLGKVLNIKEFYIDKSVIASYFLMNIDNAFMMEDKTINNLLWTLNENILLYTQYESANALLILPYSISLNFSIIMKNEDCLLNNLAILDKYLKILFDNNLQLVDDKEYFLTTIFQHYGHISECLPHNFFIKCYEYILKAQIKNNIHTKLIMRLCSPDNLMNLIEILKAKTMAIIQGEYEVPSDYYLIILQMWSNLLSLEFIKHKKKFRKRLVNHFCYILSRTFIFNTKKIPTEKGMILLIQLLCSLLKLSWINKTILINCSLRIMTYIEKRPFVSNIELLIEAAELLIVLYKCPNNIIKSLLGLYVNSFTNLLKKCWSFIIGTITIDEELPTRKLFLPFHKLELCSSLFKQHKRDFEVICQFLIAEVIKLVSTPNLLKESFMRLVYNILFNFMDICPREEMRQLMYSIRGPSILILKNAYNEYQFLIRFTGRL